jgi:hypothetical protein
MRKQILNSSSRILPFDITDRVIELFNGGRNPIRTTFFMTLRMCDLTLKILQRRYENDPKEPTEATKRFGRYGTVVLFI